MSRKSCLIPRSAFALSVFLLSLVAAQPSRVRADNYTGSAGQSNQVDNRQPGVALRYIIALVGIFPMDAQGTPTQTTPPDRSTPFLGEIKCVPFNFQPKGFAFCDGRLLVINQNQALFNLIGTTYGGNGVTTFALPDLQGRVPIGAGQGTGLPNYDLGQKVGADLPLLSVANLPTHFHTLPAGGSTGTTGRGAPFDNREASLALHFLIAADGEIMIVPWPQQPTGWTRCDGRLLASAAHTLLFNSIGTAYGGDATNFALPDLRGRIVLGDDNGISWPRGLASGSNNVVLKLNDIPPHTHTIPSGNTASAGGGANAASNYQPSLVLRQVICFDGVYPSIDGWGFPGVGELRLIGGATASGLTGNNWKLLDGSLYPVADNDNTAIFQLIGTTYGGDGQQTFGVPDLRGKLDVAATTGDGIPLGLIFGSPNLSISLAQMATHQHTLDLRITAIQHSTDGTTQLTITGTNGSLCKVDQSDDLVTWTSLTSFNFTSGTQIVTDPNPSQTLHHAYRAR